MAAILLLWTILYFRAVVMKNTVSDKIPKEFTALIREVMNSLMLSLNTL